MIGNLTNKCGTAFTYGDAMHPSAVTYNPLTGRNYTYDANGNMLTRGNQTLNWDIDNRVSSIAISGGGTTLMEYDYTGTRFKKNAPSGISYFPFQGYEIDPSGTKSKFIRIGIETFASKQTTSGGASTQYFYHNDHLGGVNVITDSTGMRVQLNEYDPWGGVSRTSGTTDPTHRFNGKELDPESGLYYYGGRYYDAEIGRFISPDPFVQAPGDPQALNRYTYVRNNPQNLIDPSGYSFWKLFKKFHFWNHRIIMNSFPDHLFVAARELSRGIVKTVINTTERVVLTAAASYFTAGALGPAGWGLMSAPLAGAVGGAAAGAANATLSGGNPLIGAATGGIAGYFGGGIPGGGFSFGDSGAAVFANEIANDFTRGFVVGTLGSLGTGNRFSAALKDGLIGGAFAAGGSQFNNLIGHAWGFVASGGQSPSFANGRFFYNSQIGFITIGNVVTGPAAFLGKLMPGTNNTFLMHEFAHTPLSRVLGGLYLPANALALGASYLISSGQGAAPFHRFNPFENKPIQPSPGKYD